ncbi:MAG TPA: PQQ-binding-like beta-propeller repeat protein [Rhizomicrobium sp.]|nr:PQQ-binding-like beta-propeller repeat protein [Rhizomicrobium sp.]
MKTLLRGATAMAVLALLANAASGAGTDWPMSGQDLGGNRYTSLSQITPANVQNLQKAWSYHLRPANAASSRFRMSQNIPLVIGNTMYIVSPYGQAIALDATTGAEKWKFDLPNGDIPSAQARGAVYWAGADGVPASILFGTLQGKLYSLRVSDGKLNTAFGEGGVVNLKTPEVMQNGMDESYILPSPPIVYKNLVITGSGPGEGPGGSTGGAGPAGDTRAWDLRTGKLVWTFHTVPRPGEFGYDTWTPEGAKNRSGVNVWGYMTVDAERGIVYMPLGAPNNDRVGTDRPGNNLFSSSLVAADANTGKYLWHFQVIYHDIWDYDTQSPPTLVDVKKDGKIIPAVITVNKNSLMFILDRVTGKPIFGVEERPVPKSDVPGEITSPTQPFPLKPEPLSQTRLSRATLYKGLPEHQAYCEKMVDDNAMKLGDIYLPPGFNQYTVSPPGTQGGVNYYGGSYDPERGLFVVNVNNLFQPMRIVQNSDGSFVNSGPMAGTRRFWDANKHLPCNPTPWGQLLAVNVHTGEIAWRTTLGITESFPAGQQETGRPGLGGTIVTASGLTFIGATDDARFRAFDTATGKNLWTVKLNASAEATPISYKGADGRQFVAITATGGGLIGAKLEGDEVVAFALPRK